MDPVTCTVDIDRPPSEVFPFVTDPSYFGEWQKGVVSGHVAGEAAVGSTCTMTRNIGGAERKTSSLITEYAPPQRWAIHAIDGPIRADVSVQVEPLDAGTRSRVTIELDFSGHGLGKLMAPLVVSRARKEVPLSCQNLKGLLEQAP
jgi:carbon monoxide dehydrogenase subunit G